MKTIILYKTRNGATKQYAKWLSEMIKAPMKEFDTVRDDDIKDNEKIYVMSGTYGGSMPLTQFLKDNWKLLKDKDITAIAVGMAPESNWWSRLSYKLIPRKIRTAIQYRKLPGFMPEKAETKKAVKKSNLESIIKK